MQAGILIRYNETMILGIDEVGRGPWAGPLVVGAVVLGSAEIDGLTDSKKLTKKRREELSQLIYDQAAGVGLGWVSADQIDEIGLSTALRLATRLAVEQITASYHEIIIDGTINFLAETSKGQYVTTLKKADLLIPSVSAASIVAKVARDAYMTEQDIVYPGYSFKSHVGYGTALHRSAIEKLGVTPLHRLSFAPLAKYKTLVSSAASEQNNSTGVTTKKIGDEAENSAALYLQTLGHTVLERNWKTKYCEIDIVSQSGETIYFTEVKYRRQSQQGGGLAAITVTKLHKMRFAARVYASYRKLSDTDMKLSVMSLTGEPPVVETFLELEES
ncbi:MAG: putative Ribonuclease [Candidatus Saccharibacteria bacterium]|nr:putative Ribonuclease [Candidatus Saccharibacteria bacterium]